MRLVVMEDQRLVREGVVELLSKHVEVVGQAANGREGLALCLQLRPDVALVDVVMPVMDGPACTREIVAAKLPTRVLAFTTHDTDAHVFSMLDAGAVGLVLKDTELPELVRAIEVVHEGQSLLSPSVTRRLIERFGRPTRALPTGVNTLSPREIEVLKVLAKGLSNEEIAQQAEIGVSTVKSHVSNLLQKLHCRDRVQLVIRAYESGLVRPGDDRAL